MHGGSPAGTAVYAAAFLRERKIILEEALLSNPPAFRLILLHELFHFVWLRLGNNARRAFSGLLLEERQRGARGELGESSAVKKQLLTKGAGDWLWRDYVCESFCDTAAWRYAGVDESDDFQLSRCWRKRREAWFEAAEQRGPWKC